MAEVTDITSIPLYQIIGAPLIAIVNAEVQAAQATVEFIEKIGFDLLPQETESTTSEDQPQESATTNGDNQPQESATTTGDNHYGRLRTVKFHYAKTGIGGKKIEFEVEVPLLSIVPIPAIQISDAKIEFAVQVNDAVNIDSKVQLSAKKELDGKNVKGQNQALESGLVMFKAGLASRDSKTAMQVTINIKQSDTPVGMLALFRAMDQGISSVSQEKKGEDKASSESQASSTN